MRENPNNRDDLLSRAGGLALGGGLVIVLALILGTSIPWAALLGLATVVAALVFIGLLRR